MRFRAARLTEHFPVGSRDPGARTDAYFDPAAQDLLAGLVFAAARAAVSAAPAS